MSDVPVEPHGMRRRRELVDALRDTDDAITLLRQAVDDGPGAPEPDEAGSLRRAPGRSEVLGESVLAARQLDDQLRRRARLWRDLRDLDLRGDADDCERQALEWLNEVETPKQLLDELVPDPLRADPALRDDVVRVKTARALLAFRNSRPGARILRLEHVLAVRGIDQGWLDDLLHTGCARLPAASEEPTPIAVMLPIRLETRFDGASLRLRVVPDDPWFDRHDPHAAEAELKAVERYLVAAAAATSTGERTIAWRGSRPRSVALAVWLVRTFVVDDGSGNLTVVWPAPGDLRTEPGFPRLEHFPRLLDVWVSRGGGGFQLATTFEVDRSRLLTSFPDPDSGDVRWWDDWDEAVTIGMAGKIPLDGDGDIDALVVIGVPETGADALFVDHRDFGGLGLLPPGTPTNTVDGAPAAGLATDPDTWLDVLQTLAGDTERDVSHTLTGVPDLLGRLPDGSESHGALNRAMVTGLWPALWGFAGQDVWGVNPGGAGAAAWAAHALFPEGPYPTLRLGSQPYGLLPATWLGGWRSVRGDPPLEAALAERLPHLVDHWAALAEARGTVVDASTSELLDLLAHVPTASGYRHRRAHPLELWWLAALLLGFPVGWLDLLGAWDGAYTLPRDLGVTPARRYGARTWSQLLRLPLVRPLDLREDVSVGDVLRELVAIAHKEPGVYQSGDRLSRRLEGVSIDSLLLRLAVRSIQVALGDIGRVEAGEPPPAPEPLVRSSSGTGRLERWIGLVGPADVVGPTPGAEAAQRVFEGLLGLVDVPDACLERLLRATVDTATYRIDPWVTGLATRRLLDIVDQAAEPPRLGAYGWVDDLRPGTPGPTSGGLVHAPSAAQGLAATVLRDRAINDDEPARWHLDVTSRRVRTADRVAQHVRIGAHLGEALGREVERIVADPAQIAGLRQSFPLRTEHAGRRTCDGLAVLAADPAAIGLGAFAADLSELRDALDVYGDLLVAEAVHAVTQGRAEAAGAAMDAAAGLSRPPVLDVLRTPRDGRTVSTSAVLVVAAAPDPVLPADPVDRATTSPATVADNATATFIAEQIGASASWTWTIGDGTTTTTVTLADLDLSPADTLALPLADIERLVVEGAADALAAEVGDLAVIDGVGSERYEQAARLVGLLGRSPALPDAVADDPAAAASGGSAADVELSARYAATRAVGELLHAALTAQLALTGPAGEIGTADVATLERLVVAARAWGIAPQPAGGPTEPIDPLVAIAAVARRLLGARLDAAPSAVAAGALGLDERTAALAALVSPTGQLAVMARLPLGDLPSLTRSAPGPDALDAEWLAVVAAVREPLARLELHQLAAGSPSGSGPAFVGWSSKPTDPWQLDAADGHRLVVAYAGPTVDLAALPAGVSVAAAVLDRFSEVVPSTEQPTSAVFGFDGPAARPPQAILLAVPPDPTVPLDSETLRNIVLDTRRLARARMARPADFDATLRAVLPTVLLPAAGRTAVPLEPTTP